MGHRAADPGVLSSGRTGSDLIIKNTVAARGLGDGAGNDQSIATEIGGGAMKPYAMPFKGETAWETHLRQLTH
jgi:hypothetical protein